MHVLIMNTLIVQAIATYVMSAKVPVNWANCSRGVQAYRKNAELLQQSIIWITESSILTFAAVVAAPILKLWPEKLL